MIAITKLLKTYRRFLQIAGLMFVSLQTFAQNYTDWQLEKMPVDLETDFALSALPAHLRSDATIYLLDPGKGYYVAHKGSNGYMCFVVRTEWEWGIFNKDVATPVSYDSVGTEAIFKVYKDVAAMRASGKFTALQIRDTVINRINKKTYNAPAKTGMSYMLAPIMRNYPGNPGDNMIMTMSVPHHMIYAPYLTNAEIGNIPHPFPGGPVVVNPGSTLLGEGKGPFGYIILTVGALEKAKIIADNKDLLERLADYKDYFKLDGAMGHH